MKWITEVIADNERKAQKEAIERLMHSKVTRVVSVEEGILIASSNRTVDIECEVVQPKHQPKHQPKNL